MKLTGKWTHEERVAVATAMLNNIIRDIPAGRYSAPGLPNCTAVIFVLNLPVDDLADYVEQSQKILDEAGDGE